MGLSYSATVFYGTYVDRDSVLGQRLDRFIDKHEGSPAPCGVRGVQICSVGALNNSPQWITIQAKGSRRTFYAGDEIATPLPLLAIDSWNAQIGRFLHEHKIEVPSLPGVGWHFAGCVS